MLLATTTAAAAAAAANVEVVDNWSAFQFHSSFHIISLLVHEIYVYLFYL